MIYLFAPSPIDDLSAMQDIWWSYLQER